MYDINLVGKIIKSSERNMKIVRFLRVLSFLLTLLLLGVLGVSAYTFLTIQKTIEEIEALRGQIDDTRRMNKVKDVENQWTEYYFKILAIKDIISGNTKAGLMLRDIGLYIPAGDNIVGIELTKDNKIVTLAKIKDFSPKYDLPSYAKVLKESYARSSFIGEPISIGTTTVSVTVSGQQIDAVRVTIPYVAVPVAADKKKQNAAAAAPNAAAGKKK